MAVHGVGEVLGNPKIDNGWSTSTHSWIVSYDECEILVLKSDYMDYLWDKMKQSVIAKEMADRMLKADCFQGLSQ